METEYVVEAVERLGGWAVVVWIVYWLTKRWEVKITEVIAASERGFQELERSFRHLAMEQKKQIDLLEKLVEQRK